MLAQAVPYVVVTATTTIGLFAGAAASNPETGLAPYVGGGAGVIAVMALGEVTRRLLNGRLIPREIRDSEAETSAYIVAAGQREDRAIKVVEDANNLVTKTAADVRQHNAKLAFDLAEVTQRQTTQMANEISALTRAVQDLHDELRQQRRGEQ